ncbi:hypothetical protein FB451DRAFT_1486607 [Mycena latifolia]|nr:hypothetical protein FB451DRAFT_1486607 [Mycena latifolia]
MKIVNIDNRLARPPPRPLLPVRTPDPAMQAFTFDSQKILKSAIYRAEDRFLQYITATEKQGFTRHRTTVRDGAVTAEIDWRDRTFQIAGDRHGVALLKRKLSNFSETRYWKWLDGEEYKVRYSNADEMWTVHVSTGVLVAELSSYGHKPKVLPVLRISEDIRESDERRFLLLVLLYSETKRLDRED